MKKKQHTRSLSDEAITALGQFLSTVQSTGGLIRLENGLHAPAIDEDWIDLGEAAIMARDVLEKAGATACLTIDESV
jgi:hypothetical protein